MIISRTPFRISFFGGGSDFPQWYTENGGAVLASSINRYSYTSCRKRPPFFEHRHRIVYSKIENINSFDEAEHRSVRSVMKTLGYEGPRGYGIEIHHAGDLPARSGIGANSAFTVGLINAVYGLKYQTISKQDLAQKAAYIEQEVAKEIVGSKDQILAAQGGFLHIQFQKDGKHKIHVVSDKDRLEQLNSKLMLYFIGSNKENKITQQDVCTYLDRARSIQKLQDQAELGLQIIEGQHSLDDFGLLMLESWKTKLELSPNMTNEKIDSILDIGLRNGALGGKALGSGCGGFVLFYVPEEKQILVRKALEGYTEVNFEFEQKGSQIVFYDPNVDEDSYPNFLRHLPSYRSALDVSLPQYEYGSFWKAVDQ